MHENSKNKERAILVGVRRSKEQRWETEDHLVELALLTDTAGAEVIDTMMQERTKIDPAYFIGKGKAETLAEVAAESDADLIVFDDDLSPGQVRNLERLTNKKIVDRSGIILDIFASRAKTWEAKTQVELAQLNYILPRLTRQWTHLSRQVGGIGTRGPGETQLEVDRRLIRKRISALTKDLEKIKNQRKVRRRGREVSYKVALVGYTNSGKSTLLNTLTNSEVFVEDRLFATLDATVRRMEVAPNLNVLLIDTVGFIRKLPHHLVASFKSTLEEAADADLLLHVVDISHPLIFEQISVVKEVLNQMEISNKPTTFVFNKIDKLKNKAFIERLKSEYEPAVFVSASKGLFLDELKKEICRKVRDSVEELDLRIDIKQSDLVSKVYDLAEVLNVEYEEDHVRMRVKANPENAQLIYKLSKEKD